MRLVGNPDEERVLTAGQRQMVKDLAYRIYLREEPIRRATDWHKAIGKLRLSVSPLNEENIRAEAHRQWEKRKETSERDDWYEAEFRLARKVHFLAA